MIDAFVKSVNEAQLEKCLESVRNQVEPFANIIHVNGVSPEVEAFNIGIKQVKSDWVMFIDGDFILYDFAVTLAQKYISEEKDQTVGEYQFGLYDPFMKKNIPSCRVTKMKLMREIRYRNWLRNDYEVVLTIEKMGFKCARLWRPPTPVVIGTHFENPDNFQIFWRFYHAGILRTSNVMRVIKQLYAQTNDSKYDLAIRSMNYGLAKGYREYPGSRDVNYDRQEYERFKNNGR